MTQTTLIRGKVFPTSQLQYESLLVNRRRRQTILVPNPLPPSAQPVPRPRTPFTFIPATQSLGQAYFQAPRVSAAPRAGRMSGGEPLFKQAKVAITRPTRPTEPGEGGLKPGRIHRVTHACEPCRQRRTKCSGERSSCRHCQNFKIQCYYADRKRDRVKKRGSPI